MHYLVQGDLPDVDVAIGTGLLILALRAFSLQDQSPHRKAILDELAAGFAAGRAAKVHLMNRVLPLPRKTRPHSDVGVGVVGFVAVVVDVGAVVAVANGALLVLASYAMPLVRSQISCCP